MLVVYTSLAPDVHEAVAEAFEARHPGVDVRMALLDAETVLERLRADGGDQADAWWGAPVPALVTAASEGRLASASPTWSEEGAPRAVRDSLGRWVGLYAEPVVFAFHADHLSRSEAPRDWIDLFHFRWAEEVLVPDPEVAPEVAWLFADRIFRERRRTGQLIAGFDWLRRLDEAVLEYVSDPADVFRRLSIGEGRLAVVGLPEAVEARRGRYPEVEFFLPESGSPPLLRGAAVLAEAPEPELARAFLELVGDSSTASAVVDGAHLLPVRGGLPPEAGPDWPRGIEGEGLLQVPVDSVAPEVEGWMRRWTREVRGRGGGVF